MSAGKRAEALANRHKEAGLGSIAERISQSDIKSQIGEALNTVKERAIDAAQHPRQWAANNKPLLATTGVGAAAGGLLGMRDGGGLGGALAGATAGGLVGAGGHTVYRQLAPKLTGGAGAEIPIPEDKEEPGLVGKAVDTVLQGPAAAKRLILGAPGLVGEAAGTALDRPISATLTGGAIASDAYTLKRRRKGLPELGDVGNPFRVRPDSWWSRLRYGSVDNERRIKTKKIVDRLKEFTDTLATDDPDKPFWTKMRAAARGTDAKSQTLVHDLLEAAAGNDDAKFKTLAGQVGDIPAGETAEKLKKQLNTLADDALQDVKGSLAPARGKGKQVRDQAFGGAKKKFQAGVNQLAGEVSEDAQKYVTPRAVNQVFSRDGSSFRSGFRRSRGYLGLLAAMGIEPYLRKGLVNALASGDGPSEEEARRLLDALNSR